MWFLLLHVLFGESSERVFTRIQNEIHARLKFHSGAKFFSFTCKIHGGVKWFFNSNVGCKSYRISAENMYMRFQVSIWNSQK